MPWPVATPDAIAQRYYGAIQTAFEIAPDGSVRQFDASQPNSVTGVLGGVSAEALYDGYLYQANLANELMPDTATAGSNGWLPRHGDIWGIPREQPTAAIGNVLLAGAPTTVWPIGVEFAYGAQVYASTAEVTVPSGGVATIPVAAEVAGSAGNLAANTSVLLVSEISGVTTGAIPAVDGNGLAGGTDIQDVEDWRAAILARIRVKTYGGRVQDYTQWANAAGAPYVNVVKNWVGGGSVGVIVAMPGPAAPTTAQLAAIQTALNAQAPVTAWVVAVAATLVPINFSLSLSPDTIAGRANATAALGTWLAQAQPGALLDLDQAERAVAAGVGSADFLIAAPADNLQMAATEMPVLGSVTFGATPAATPT